MISKENSNKELVSKTYVRKINTKYGLNTNLFDINRLYRIEGCPVYKEPDSSNIGCPRHKK